LTLVLDANVAAAACAEADGFAELRDVDLVAPPLLWSEFFSFVHEARFRADLTEDQADRLLNTLEASPLRSQAPAELHRTAWRIADQLGLARTYDAEYVALAQILGCRLVTLDLRLRRGAHELGFVITPTELIAAREAGREHDPEST